MADPGQRLPRGRLLVRAVIAALGLTAGVLGALLVVHDGRAGAATADDAVAFFAVGAVLLAVAGGLAARPLGRAAGGGAALAALTAFVYAGHVVYDPNGSRARLAALAAVGAAAILALSLRTLRRGRR
jgi:peptidoglycan/LPS O-acetylase OafA/YrhL